MSYPELDGLRGGSKQMWLRQHQPEVVNYWWKQGTAATLFEFNISLIFTLERLLDHAGIALWGGWEGYGGGGVSRLQTSDKSLSIRVGTGTRKSLTLYLPDVELIRRQDPCGLGAWAKHRWLQFHRDEVIEYYRGHGFFATRVKYHCATETLGHLLGMPHDKKGRIKWKSAIPMPMDHIERKVDLLISSVLEEIECRRVIREGNFKLRRDTQDFIRSALYAIVRALEKAFPERDIGDLVQQEFHKLPSLLQPTLAHSISIPELCQAFGETEASLV